MTLRVAIFQGGFANNAKKNLELLERTIQGESDKGIELFVFCELFLCGYLNGKDFSEVAEDAKGPSFEFVSKIAIKFGIAIAYGYAEKDSVNPKNIYNSVQIIDKNGISILNYRKTHLWSDYERQYFVPGDSLPNVIDFNGIKMSALICYDIEFVEPARILALEGAQLLIVPTALMNVTMCKMTIQSRSYENHLFICYANLVGREKTNDGEAIFIGNSLIVAPDGTELARGSSDKEEVLIRDLDFTNVKYEEKRSRNPYHQDRRPDLYDRLLRK
eukprot:TRINITY_DN996_c0_g1_i1.p1 TRINITY_DN996_c0_g1~~TRINITY_DN996_c0_g1_i1.p1  ORF type:complete len:274 (+),score=29.40 TRINITY_DN996_c0_g1_i1:56-877(+)